ncbi:hypothetical protein TWF718_001457 [Orbilia javanica]|uniref:Ester cyclase n=1 Tax=Orbilia javanica TaxID=47235 RepID=A0AAN8N5F5_9PEZI
MTTLGLKQLYRAYIEAINDRNWALVTTLIHPIVIWNQRSYPAAEYITLMTRTTDPTPDLKFHIDILLSDDEGQMIAARLLIRGTPKREFLGFTPIGKSVEVVEHVFYRFAEGRIKEVKTVIDMEGLRDQMLDAPAIFIQ